MPPLAWGCSRREGKNGGWGSIKRRCEEGGEVALGSRAEDGETREGLLCQRVDFAVDADSTRDPGSALVLYNWQFEEREGVNP